MITRPVLLLQFAAILLTLTACAAAPPVETVADPRLDILVEGVETCLENQALANEKLAGQAQQLEWQLQQLEGMSRQLETAEKARNVGKRPAARSCPKPAKASDKQLVGYLEKVWLADLQLALTARLDTGTETATLHARNIEQFERDGKPWVRFEVVNPSTGEPVSMQSKVRRTVGSAGAKGEDNRRPVVKLGILVGTINQSAEFSLSERTHSQYQLNIGRDQLRDLMVVDASAKNIAPFTLPDKPADAAGATK